MPDVSVSRARWPAAGGASNAAQVLFQGMEVLPAEGLSSESAPRFLNRVCAVPASSIYRRYFDRRKRTLARLNCEFLSLEVDGRLFIGMSTASLFETGITLDSTYGVPVIAGQACKGLARRAGKALLPDPLFMAMFGTPDDQHGVGMVHFFDALWEPGSAPPRHATVLKWVYPEALRWQLGRDELIPTIDGGQYPLVREIVNPHHPDFATGEHRATPFDAPKPVPLIATHGRFLFAVRGVPLWRRHAADLLKAALQTEGIGARTPEYGRFL